MRICMNWLKKYVLIRESKQELSDMLTMLGVETHVPAESNFSDVVIGKVIDVKKHPHADQLNLCVVSDGKDEFQVICGAPNVQVGQKVPFAKIGAQLGADIRIKKIKIRGSVSFGMICSERELDLSDDHHGIMVLNEDAEIGKDFNQYLLKNQDYLEVDLTPNRTDCMSHYGIAREISLKTGRRLKPIDCTARKFKSNVVKSMISVQIEDKHACPRYMAGVVKSITLGPSPVWMQSALKSAGQRSINNIVDISNYVLMEMGHPTHIFDYNSLPSKTILIRKAKKGEQIVTLDEKKRMLTTELLITDGEEPIALAGIMGGVSSAVTKATKDVLIESAYFDPITVRRDSKTLGLSTEASKRFERGADPEGAINAFWRVVELLEQIAGGEWVPGVIDACPLKITVKKIKLTRKKIDILAGTKMTNTFIENCLFALNIRYVKKGMAWICTPPSYRPDLERETDLIEELCRLFGYDKINASFQYSGIYEISEIDPEKLLSAITREMKGLGFNQCIINSLTDEKTASLSKVKAISTMNPLSNKMSSLRTSLYPGLLTILNHNIHNHNQHVRLYEIGKIYHKSKTYIEKLQLVAIVHGQLIANHAHGKSVDHSFYSIKGLITGLINRLKLTGITFSTAVHDNFEYGVDILSHKKIVGHCGQLRSELLITLGIDTEMVFGFHLDLELIFALLQKHYHYQQVHLYPKVERDINLVFNRVYEAGDIVKSIEKLKNDFLISIQIKNIYNHKSLGKNNKSITFNLTFQSPIKTLEEVEISNVINDITAVIEKDFGAKLRD